MKRLNQQGVASFLLPFVIVLVLFLGTAVFAVWAFQGRQDYKNHTDAKIAVAQQQAANAQSKADEAKYNELAKQPLVQYKGPEAYGSVIVSYPKTWSAYVSTGGGSLSNGTVVDGYFDPGVVPSTSSKDSTFALRLQILSQAYSTAVANLTNSNQKSPPKVAPYSLPKLPNVVGVRLDGAISEGKTGTMIVLPLRDKTLEVWTEAPQFENDFSTYILPNLTFSP